MQTTEPELPPSPPVPEVTTPEPGIYQGICEYLLWGQCQGKEDLHGSGVGRESWPLGTGFPGTVGQVVPWHRDTRPQDKSGLKPACIGDTGPGRAASLQKRGLPGSVPSQRGTSAFHTQTSYVLAAALTREAAVGVQKL